MEIIEKNHKHEVGVEIAHHKETQKQLHKVTDELKELKVKCEEKERALDMLNIYSRKINSSANNINDSASVVNQQHQHHQQQQQHSTWKMSTQSLNSSFQETPSVEKRKEYDRKRRELRNSSSVCLLFFLVVGLMDVNFY